MIIALLVSRRCLISIDTSGIFFRPSLLDLLKDHQCHYHACNPCENPCRRIGCNGQIVVVQIYRTEGCYHSDCKFDEAHDSCDTGVADGLDRVPEDEDHCEEIVADCALDDVCSGPRDVDRYVDFGVKEDPENVGHQEDREQCGYYGIDDVDLKRCVDALADPFHVACAVVLTGISCHGLTDGEHALGDDVLELACCGDRCNCNRIECVKSTLHDDRARSRDTILDGHRDTVAELLSDGCGTEFPVAFCRP